MRVNARQPEIEPDAARTLGKLPKAALMEILRDFAIQYVGEEEHDKFPTAWLTAISERHATLKANGLSR